MKLKAGLLSFILFTVLISSCAAAFANDAFSDCSDWAAENIKEAVDSGIVPEKLQFNYTDDITRDDFCRLVMEAYTFKTGYTYASDRDNFKDTGQNYIDAAYELGIVNGVGNNMFAPERPITRQEAAVMLSNLARLCGLEKEDAIMQYTDEAEFASWAKDSIYEISSCRGSNGISIMTGTGEGRFSPFSNLTREQAIVTMARLVSA